MTGWSSSDVAGGWSCCWLLFLVVLASEKISKGFFSKVLDCTVAWTGGGIADGLLSASATTLDLPAMCRRSVVNSDTNAKCRPCRAEAGGDTLCMAKVKGLWSVRRVNLLPSKTKRKCLTAAKAANSSLSNAEYLV
jgi:hypothetical protein